MRNFRGAVREINLTIGGILLFPILINAILIFLGCYFLLMVLDFQGLYASVPALAYLVIASSDELWINKVRLVEKKFPQLNEKLRTAADYADQEGLLIDHLHKEVMEDLKNVFLSAFFNTRRNIGKIMLIVVLCFAILFFTSLNLDLSFLKEQAGNLIDKAQDQLGAAGIGAGSGQGSGLMTAGGSGAGGGINDDIFGDKSLAVLGNEKLDVELRPSEFEFSFRNVKEAEKREFESDFPVDMSLQSASTYEENIPKEQQEIVKTYFRKLTGLE